MDGLIVSNLHTGPVSHLRILFCNYEYPPLGGGGGVVMAALCRQLAKQHDVTVVTSRALDLPAESVEGGVRVLRVPVFFRNRRAVANIPSMLAYPPMAVLRMLGRRLRGAYDVINTHFAVPSGPAGQCLSSLLRIPNVLSLHGGDLYDPSKEMSPHRQGWLRGPVRSMLRKADVLVGHSNDTVRHVSEIYGVQRDVQLVPLGIDRPPRPGRFSRADLGLPEQAFVMATVGRLVPRKSSAQLVRVLAESRIPDAYLLVVGDGPDADAIRRAAAERGVSDRVRLLGFVSEQQKSVALAMSDVFVSTSQHEGFGLAFLEAMAFGLPIVCYDHGGQTDFLSSTVTGAVVPLNDLGAFTNAVRALAADRATLQRIGANNRRRVEDYFIERCAQRYEAVFDLAMANRGRAAESSIR